MDLAVIKTGGKQYLVRSGEKLEVEKLKVNTGETLQLVPLLVWSNNQVQLGSGQVEIRVLGEKRAKKITVFKYKPKVRYRRTKGHHQLLTLIEIVSIAT